MKKKSAIICFLAILLLFLLGILVIYYCCFIDNTGNGIQKTEVSFENNPYAWEDTKEFFESKGCKRAYVIEWDIPEDNKVKEENYINDSGEKLTLNWYADGTADAMLVSSRP